MRSSHELHITYPISDTLTAKALGSEHISWQTFVTKKCSIPGFSQSSQQPSSHLESFHQPFGADIANYPIKG